MVDSLRERVDVGKFFDDEGVVRMGKETVELWGEHYKQRSFLMEGRDDQGGAG